MEQNPRSSDNVLELMPLKSALVNHSNSNNNHSNESSSGPSSSSFTNPNSNHPSSASLFDYQFLSKRSTVSKKLLSSQAQFKNEEFNVPQLALGSGPTPSRKREERETMQNLRRRVPPQHLPKPFRQPEPTVQTSEQPEKDKKKEPSKVVQKLLSHRPLSMVVEPNEVQTAWQDSDFITECLCWHNVYRQRHGAPTLTMSPELCSYAQAWANHLAHTNKFSYRNDREVGQNLFQRPVSTLQGDVTGQEVSSYWYAAVRQYNFFKEPDILHANVNAGHFTQIVWCATRNFGVGKAQSRAGKIIVVAHYSPPGNISGGFEINVLPPIPDYNVPGPIKYDFENNHQLLSKTVSETSSSSSSPSDDQ